MDNDSRPIISRRSRWPRRTECPPPLKRLPATTPRSRSCTPPSTTPLSPPAHCTRPTDQPTMPRPTSASVTVVVVAVLALAACAASQAPMPAAAGPSADCGNAVTGLIGCLSYITPGNAQSKPPSDCCTEVKSALGSPATVACLCDAFGKDYGIPINLTRAAGLPAACGGNPAAFSKCHLKLPGAPGAAPTQAPSPSSGSTTPATGSSGPAKSAATRSPISAATVVLAAVAAPLLSYYYL